MTAFAWALIGPGRIARRFADAVAEMPDAGLRAVLGRDATRAADFAANCTNVDGSHPVVARSFDELLADPRIDGVYVATPHAQHGGWVRQCLDAGKPVLCEKPLVPNLAQGRALVDLARERQVFLMEAVWTRFLPVYAVVAQWLRDQSIGELRGMQSSFCFYAPFAPVGRLYNPALAGGALLDIRIYNLAVTRWVMQTALGACPEPLSIDATGVLAPFRVNGFEYEIEEAQRCVRDGLIESPLMTHADTLATLGWMDEIRRQVGVRYPFE